MSSREHSLERAPSVPTRRRGGAALVLAFVTGLALAGDNPLTDRLADDALAALSSGGVEPELASSLARLLPKVVSRRHLPRLIALLEAPTSRPYKGELVRAIAATGAPEAKATLLELLSEPSLTREAALALRNLGAAADAVSRLRSLAKNEPSAEHVRRLARILADLGDDSDETLGLIRSTIPRAEQVDLLSRIRSPKVIPLLIEAFDWKETTIFKVDRELQKLTLAADCSGKEAWQKWWAENGATFRLLGTRQEDVSRLVDLLLSERDPNLSEEILRRLGPYKEKALALLTAELSAPDVSRALAALAILSEKTGDAGRAALAGAILRGKPFNPSISDELAPKLAAHFRTAGELSGFLSNPQLPDDLKGAVLEEVIRASNLDFVQVLAESLAKAAPPVRSRLLAALALAREEKFFDLFLRAAKPDDPDVQALLAAKTKRPKLNQRLCIKYLAKGGLERDRALLLLRGLSGAASVGEAREAVLGYLASPDEALRRAALEAIASCLDAGGVEVLAAQIPREPSSALAAKMLAAAAETRSDRALEVVANALKSSNRAVQSAAARSLAPFGGTPLQDKAAALALEYLDSVPEDARDDLIAFALRTVREPTRAKLRALLAREGGASPGVILGLAALDDTASVERIKLLHSDRDAALRTAIVVALAHLGDRDGEKSWTGLLGAPGADLRLALDYAVKLESMRLVPGLIDRLAVEKDAGRKREIVRALSKITGQGFPADAAQWRKWFESRKPEKKP